MDDAVGTEFIARSRYYLVEEYPAKIAAAVRAMPADRVWWRPNEQSNSAGNLVLHLCGNVRQWVVGGIGGAEDQRERDLEFSARAGPDPDALIARLRGVIAEVDAVLASLRSDQLMEPRSIQGRETTVLRALYHVVEHFSTHTGQIVWLGKMWSQAGEVRFYDDTRNAAPLFLPKGRSDI